MKQLAALAAAVAMVAGAWALRDRFVDDGPGGTGGDTPETVRLLCATELEPVCGQSGGPGVTIELEDPGVTADRLAELDQGADPGFDAWLVDGPWARMVADDRAFAGTPGEVLGEPSATLARSPAVLVVQDARRAALEQACGGEITWRCVGEQAGAFRVGLTAPDRGDGLVPLAEAVGGFFGTTDYSAGDFEEPGFTAWFDRLTQLSTSDSVRLGDRSALQAAVGQAGTFNVVGALEAEARTLLRDRGGWSTLYPDPMSIAEVQLVPRDGARADELLEALDADGLTGALADSGWRTGDGAGDPPLPRGSGLPAAGVLNALRDLW